MNAERKPASKPADSLATGPQPAAPNRIVESTELLRGQAEVVIRHEGRIYRLRRTRLGKLILTA